MLPKAHLTLHSSMSGSRWVITPLWLSGSWRSFLYSSSVYYCHLFLISSVSVRSIPFLSLLHHLCMKCFLGISKFLEETIVFFIYCFLLFLCIVHVGRLFLSLLTILWKSEFRWVCLSSSPLPFASLLFSAICKASSVNHFAFLYFYFLGIILITASCRILQTSIHSSSGTMSIRSNPLNLCVTSTV